MKAEYNKRGICTNAKREFVVCSDVWYILYNWIESDGYFSYGLTLRYKQTGTDFKYLHTGSRKYSSEVEMKKAIKSEIAKWLKSKQKQYDIETLPVCEVQNILHPQLKIFD